MKKSMKKIVILAMAASVLATSPLITAVPVMAATNPTIAVAEVSNTSYAIDTVKAAADTSTIAVTSSVANKINAFIKDSRWKNGLSWPQRSPKLSKWKSKGCCAYAADFCKYVYGYNWMTNTSRFKKYTNANNIQTGDIIHTSNHWFVVIRRDGKKLYTAEGAYSNKTRVSTAKPGYYIENGKLYMSWYNNSTTKLKYKAVSFVYGYHFN